MPLLEDLVQELQQRLSAQSSSIPSSAAVAEAAQSERINVTLPGGVMEELKRHALAEGRSCGNLASYLIEDGLRRHRPLSQNDA
ncbi:MAG: CopG family transcriptional regulator [Synechococcus sp. ARS1019]|nr:CopG family transcriptional regulator [Synechococcus sp. ARS1019]